MTADPFEELRRQMIAVIAAETVFLTGELGKASLDRRVLEIMGRVPRHAFVPVELRAYAYANTPLPIGFEKTISQPFIVALMTELTEPQPNARVLEVGTGSGYQAAVLAELAETKA